MGTRVPTRQKYLSQLESSDALLKIILSTITKRHPPVNLEPLVELLLEKDQQLKVTLTEVEKQTSIFKQIEILRADCAKSDKQISACQVQLKKAEILLSTALYYSRQKLDAMATAVNNPVDIEEVVKLSHHISATHGVCAPDNWIQGDPRRPYPNKEEIRRGYLGHLDDDGMFHSSLLDVLSDTAAAASSQCSSATASGNTSVIGISNSSGHPPGVASASTVHPADMLTVSASPTLVLPGVNMVSSPMIAVNQANTNTWAGGISGATATTVNSTSSNSAMGADASPSSNRPHAVSLASILTGGSVNTGLLDSQSRFATVPTGGSLVPPTLSTMRANTANSGGSSRIPVTTATGITANTGNKLSGRATTQSSSLSQTKTHHPNVNQQHTHQQYNQNTVASHQGIHFASASEMAVVSTGAAQKRSKVYKRQLLAHGDTETLSSVSSSESSTGDY